MPEGTVGRLQVRGATVMRGYFDDEAASRAVLGADGWLTSGNLGFLRAGRLSLTGREKEMIIIRGANFPCHGIEEVAGGVAAWSRPGWARARSPTRASAAKGWPSSSSPESPRSSPRPR